MPVYEYKCTICNYCFEAEQKMAEKPLQHCPTCSGPVRRVINPVGVVFKGSGFYITDNKPKEEKKNSKHYKPKKEEKAAEKPKEKESS
jgi:putative FmdB family regulatory protein